MNMNQIWARFMNIDRKIIVRELPFVIGLLVLFLVVTMVAVVVKTRFGDGSSIFFSGGPLVAGELVTGPEPDWSSTQNRMLIELQLLNPPRSRRLAAVAYDGKLYTNSHYMGGIKQLLWKRWPGQAEQDGRAVIRLCRPGLGLLAPDCKQGPRYERELVRIELSPGTADIVKGVTAGFDGGPRASFTPEQVEAGELWLFELAPRNMTGDSR